MNIETSLIAIYDNMNWRNEELSARKFKDEA
jgi:hypothetical protein